MQGLSRLGVEPSPEEIQLLFKKYDDDGVGNVNYVAFSRTVDALEQVSLAHRHRLRTPTLSLEPSRNPNPCPYPCPCPCCSSPTGARRRPYISPMSPIALTYISPVLRPEQGGGGQAQHAVRRLEAAQGAPRLPRQLQVRPDLLGGRWGGDGVQPAAGPLPPAWRAVVARSHYRLQ